MPVARRVMKVLSYRWNEELYGPGAHSLSSGKGLKSKNYMLKPDYVWLVGRWVGGLGDLKCKNFMRMPDCAWLAFRQRWQGLS